MSRIVVCKNLVSLFLNVLIFILAISISVEIHKVNMIIITLILSKVNMGDNDVIVPIGLNNFNLCINIVFYKKM